MSSRQKRRVRLSKDTWWSSGRRWSDWLSNAASLITRSLDRFITGNSPGFSSAEKEMTCFFLLCVARSAAFFGLATLLICQWDGPATTW